MSMRDMLLLFELNSTALTMICQPAANRKSSICFAASNTCFLKIALFALTWKPDKMLLSSYCRQLQYYGKVCVSVWCHSDHCTFLNFALSGCCKILSNICNSVETHIASLSGLLSLKSIIWLCKIFPILSLLSFTSGSCFSAAHVNSFSPSLMEEVGQQTWTVVANAVAGLHSARQVLQRLVKSRQ